MEENIKDQLPAMPFYFGDWRKSPEIRALDLDVRMIWFEMLGLMWESTERGYLTLNGKVVKTPVIAKMLGIDITTLEHALQQMEEFNVYSRRDDGAIFSRKMVRDEEKRKAKSRAGQYGMSKRYNKDLHVESNSVITPPITPLITTPLTNPINENEVINEIDFDKEEGVQGEEQHTETGQGKPETRIAIDYQFIVDNYHSLCPNMRRVEVISDERKGYMNARVGEFGMQKVIEVLRKAGESEWLNGRNDRAWKADFEWIIRPRNFIKILEGKYSQNGRFNNKAPDGSTAEDIARSQAEKLGITIIDPR